MKTTADQEIMGGGERGAEKCEQCVRRIRGKKTIVFLVGEITACLYARKNNSEGKTSSKR